LFFGGFALGIEAASFFVFGFFCQKTKKIERIARPNAQKE
jgi:hypothetical protein